MIRKWFDLSALVLVPIYLIFSILYLFSLLFFHFIHHEAIIILLLITLLSIPTFFFDIYKKQQRDFFPIFLIMLFIIYVLESPSFFSATAKTYPLAEGIAPSIFIPFSFLVIFSGIVSSILYHYRNGKSMSLKDTIAVFLRPHIPEEYTNKVAGSIVMLFAIFFIIFFILSMSTPSSSWDFSLFSFFAIRFLFLFFIIKIYMSDGFEYSILFLTGTVSTLLYFRVSYYQQISILDTLWLLPFVLAGFWTFMEMFIEWRKKIPAKEFDKKEWLTFK